ncbi:MAG: hypothetical protein DHS20C21_06460 [Gemmatimonadota bacterium]|nr:MAG: hypothetical protein DHS20C21_06460 [Gemmatimonadota bacterium]
MSKSGLRIDGGTLPTIVCLLIAVNAANAETWDVPGDFATIQAAIDASSEGDSIHVGPGTWTGENRNVQACTNFVTRHSVMFLKAGVTIVGVDGPEKTILDGGPTGPGGTPVRTVYLLGATGPTARVEGFTITGGGMGVASGCSSTLLEVRDCWLDGNLGNGVSVSQAPILLEDCRVTNSQGVNTSSDGGVSGSGGSSLTAIRTVFESNATGAIQMHDADSVVIDQCEFIGHTSHGGILLRNCPGFELTRCLFNGNSRPGSGQHGGAVFVGESNGTIEFCTFVDNSAPGATGGAIYVRDSSGISIANNTIVDCHALVGGAVLLGSVGATVHNNVVSDCTGTALAAFNSTIVGSGCNLLWNNDVDYFAGWDATAGDVQADPLFCDPEQGDYTIGQLSPAAELNAGPCGAMGAHEIGCGTIQVRPASWGQTKSMYR